MDVAHVGKVFMSGEGYTGLMGERSVLKVELCEGCATMTERFSELYEQLKRVEMEMGSCVRGIQGKLIEAKKAGKTEMFRKKVSKLKAEGNLDVLEALRSETLDKCSKFYGGTTRTDGEQLESDFETQPTRPDIDIGAVFKTECSSPPPPDSDEEEAVPAYLEVTDLDLDMENAEPSPPALPEIDLKFEVKFESPELSHSKKSGQPPQLPYIILPDTGHYKCTVCSLTFPKYDTFRQHHNTVHLQMKLRCVDCGKEFQHRGNYYRHRQRMHEKIRVKCDICKKSFPKGYIDDHRRETHGKGKGKDAPKPKKHVCELCGNEYKHSSSLRNHLRKDH